MNRIILSAFLVPFLFSSCAGGPGKLVLTPPETPEAWMTSWPYIITEFKDKIRGQNMPEWADRWFEGGISEVEALYAYQDHYVFISRNEGNNFYALTQWTEGFNADLDFPRLAAARIETRLLSGVSLPDNVYGAFFETLIRAASDTPWTGAVREDDFWVHRKFFPDEDEISEMDIDSENRGSSLISENWEFLILVTIEKSLFASQLDAVFRSIRPNPQPTREQVNAANRVKDRFFDGF